jgi:adenosylhomocysteine nucleosidase
VSKTLIHASQTLTYASEMLIMVALAMEARGLAARLGLAATTGEGMDYGGPGAHLACVGLRAGRLAAGRPWPVRPGTIVVSAGTCGGLTPDLGAGSVVVPEDVVTVAGTRRLTAAVPGLRRSGTLLTTVAAVETREAKARLRAETGAVAVDMESAAILDWAAARGLAAVVVRGVADPASRGVPADLAATVDPGGRVRAARALAAMLTRPPRIADAVALGLATRRALAATARALAPLVAGLRAGR